MFSEAKVTEIYCMADDFCKEFVLQQEKFMVEDKSCKHRNKPNRMSNAEIMAIPILFVSIRPSTGAKPLYTLIAAVPIHLIVVVAIVLLNLYVATSASYQIPHFILSKHSPDAATSIYGEADLIAPHGLPFCNRAFVR